VVLAVLAKKLEANAQFILEKSDLEEAYNIFDPTLI
jgi:hypothetical protein